MEYHLRMRLSRVVRFTRSSLSVTTTIDEKLALVPYIFAASIASLIPISRYDFVAGIWGLVRYVTQPERRHHSRCAQRLASRELVSKFDIEVKNLLAFKSYVRFWIENLAHLVEGPPRTTYNLTMEGSQAVTEWLSTGRGAIIATAHIGNPDWGGIAISKTITPLAAIFGPLEPPIFEKWSYHLRTKMGLETIFLSDSNVTKQIINKIDEGKLVALTCDFNISGNALEVEMFSKFIPLASGPATISLRTNTPVFPGTAFMKPDGGHHLLFGPPIFPKDIHGESVSHRIKLITQTIGKELESQISMASEQWHVVVPLTIKNSLSTSSSPKL